MTSWLVVDLASLVIVLVPLIALLWALTLLYRLAIVPDLAHALSSYTMFDLDAYGQFQQFVQRARSSPGGPSSGAAPAPARTDDDANSHENLRDYCELLLRYRETKYNPPDRVDTHEIPFEIADNRLLIRFDVPPPSDASNQSSPNSQSVSQSASNSQPIDSQSTSDEQTTSEEREDSQRSAEAPRTWQKIVGLEFELLTTSDCSVQVFWDVAVSELMAALSLSTDGSLRPANEDERLPSLCGLSALAPTTLTLCHEASGAEQQWSSHRCVLSSLDVQLSHAPTSGFEPLTDEYLPLVVVVTSAAEPGARLVSACHLSGGGQAVVYKQYYQPAAAATYELGDIYGVADTETDCTVCFSEPRDVVLLPCGHFCVGKRCLPKLTQCPLCRSHIASYLRGVVSGLTREARHDDADQTVVDVDSARPEQSSREDVDEEDSYEIEVV